MKRIFALVIALMVAFTALPAIAQRNGAAAAPQLRPTAYEDTRAEAAPRQHSEATDASNYSNDFNPFYDLGGKPAEGAFRDDLDAALNVEGGTIHFKDEYPEYPWTVVEEGDRTYAISGGAGIDYAISVISATVEVEAGEVVSFDFKAWGEGDIVIWDSCNFYVNNRRVLYEGALDNDWTRFTFIFEESGTYMLFWAYMKDNYDSPEGDYFAVDNVYIGEPVPVEQIIATESLDIVVNRGGALEWTVLPEEADAYNAVLFECADPDIAFVDMDGVVHGMSEGVTTVTVYSRIDPEVYAVCEVTVTDTGIPLARLYGRVAYDNTEEYIGKWITFTDATPQNVEVIGEGANVRSAAYAYGNVFGFLENGCFFIADFNDLSNPTIFPCPFEEDWWITALTYDYTRGCLIGLCAADHNYEIGAFSPADGTLLGYVPLQDDERTFYGLCADEEGNLYTISRGGGNLFTIDPYTGEMTMIGTASLPCQYNQDICYDYASGDIYWAQFYGQEWCYLYRLDKTTGEATNCGKICPDGAEVLGLFMIPENEPGAADDVAVTGVNIRPEDAMIHIGDTASFRAFILPFNASNRNVVWSVDDESIISVDENGTVTGLAVGTANVTVTTEDGGFTASAAVTVLPPLGELVTGFYFEEQEEVDQWTFIDADGDGHNWEWGYMTSYTYEGQGVIYSESFSYETYESYTPDNWAVSPAIELGEGAATVTFWYVGQDEEYADEHFQVYAGTTPDIDSMVPVSREFIAGGDYQQGEAVLTEFAGGTVYIAFRHFNCEEMSSLNIDQVEIFLNNGEEPGIHGDVDLNGTVEVTDAILALRYQMGLVELTDEQLAQAEVTGDGQVTLADAILILRYAMGLIDHFPIEG